MTVTLKVPATQAGVDLKNCASVTSGDTSQITGNFSESSAKSLANAVTRIMQIAADYKDKGVAVVAIEPNNPDAVMLDEMGYTDVGDSFEEMKIRAEYRHFNFPYLYDGETQKVSTAYGPTATPHLFICFHFFAKLLVERKRWLEAAFDLHRCEAKLS